MPLSQPNPDNKFKKFQKGVGRITSKIVQKNLVEVSLILLILVNLLTNLKVVLTIYVFLYFFDRWDLIGIFKKDKITVVHKEDDTKI